MRNVMWWLIAVTVVAGLCVGSAHAAGNVLYSEDFESSSDLQLLSESPHSWTKYFNTPRTVQISDDTSLDGLAIDGSTLSGDAYSLYNVTFDGGATFEQGKFYTVSFDAYAEASDTGCTIGLTDNGVGIYAPIGPNATGTGWAGDWAAVIAGSGPGTIVDGDGIGEVVHIVMYVDLRGVTDQIWASVSDGVKTWTTAKYEMDARQLVNSIGYWENQQAGSFDIDNIVVAEVPEETWETLLDEDFEAYPDGTWLSTAAGWTSIFGDVMITNHWMTFSQIIQGSTITSKYPAAPTRFTRDLSRSVRKNEHIRAMATLHNRWSTPGSYFGISSSALTQPKGAIWQCDGTVWYLIVLPPFVNEGEDVVAGPYWNRTTESPTWDHLILRAEIHLDAEADTVWGVIRLLDGSVAYTSSVVPIIDGSENQVDVAYLWWTGLNPGNDGLDVDDILVEVQALPPVGTVVVVK